MAYVGQTTRTVAERLRGHVQGGSPLGRRLRGNVTGWLLDVYDLPSARAMWPDELHGAGTLDAAERALIERYQPALNTAGTRKGKRQARRKQADWGFGRWLRHLLSGS